MYCELMEKWRFMPTGCFRIISKPRETEVDQQNQHLAFADAFSKGLPYF